MGDQINGAGSVITTPSPCENLETLAPVIPHSAEKMACHRNDSTPMVRDMDTENYPVIIPQPIRKTATAAAVMLLGLEWIDESVKESLVLAVSDQPDAETGAIGNGAAYALEEAMRLIADTIAGEREAAKKLYVIMNEVAQEDRHVA